MNRKKSHGKLTKTKHHQEVSRRNIPKEPTMCIQNKLLIYRRTDKITTNKRSARKFDYKHYKRTSHLEWEMSLHT